MWESRMVEDVAYDWPDEATSQRWASSWPTKNGSIKKEGVGKSGPHEADPIALLNKQPSSTVHAWAKKSAELETA